MSLVGPAFFLSGFAALLYETLWVRLLALACGNTTLAVSAVLAAFMAGLALGSWLGGVLADRGYPWARYAYLELGIAAGGWLSGPAIALASRVLLSFNLVERPPWVQSLAYFAAALGILLIPAALMGATLPVLARSAGGQDKTADRPLGLLYGLNTLGAVLGAAAAGFWLLPAWGISRSLLLAGSLNILAAALTWGRP